MSKFKRKGQRDGDMAEGLLSVFLSMQINRMRDKGASNHELETYATAFWERIG